MSESEINSVLTMEAKTAINNYLFKWFSWLGIGNLAVILSAISFVFFVLPDRATDQVKGIVSAQILSLSQHMQSTVGSVLVKSGEASKEISQINTNAQESAKAVNAIDADASKLKMRMDKLRDQIETLEKNPKINVADILTILNSHQDISSLLQKVIEIEKESNRLKVDQNDIKTALDKTTNIATEGKQIGLNAKAAADAKSCYLNGDGGHGLSWGQCPFGGTYAGGLGGLPPIDNVAGINQYNVWKQSTYAWLCCK